MATANGITIETLRARVEALGHKLIEDDWAEAARDERPGPGLYILDPKGDKLVLVMPSHRGADPRQALVEIETWCVDRETDIADAKLRFDATADDFRGPHVRAAYERFLERLELVGLKDRLHATRLRKTEGVEAAVDYLNECNLTSEVQSAATPNIAEAADKIRNAIRYTQLCAAAVLACDYVDSREEAQRVLGDDVWRILQEALVALGVARLDERGCFVDTAEQPAGGAA
jgi:hypothetical protein